MKKVLFVLIFLSLNFVMFAQYGDFTTINLRPINVPSTTTNKLYNFGTHLYWNGVRLDSIYQGGGGSMVYPTAGIAVSTGSAWGTSLTDNSTNWNSAYGWGNHAGLYFEIGDTNINQKPITLHYFNTHLPSNYFSRSGGMISPTVSTDTISANIFDVKQDGKLRFSYDDVESWLWCTDEGLRIEGGGLDQGNSATISVNKLAEIALGASYRFKNAQVSIMGYEPKLSFGVYGKSHYANLSIDTNSIYSFYHNDLGTEADPFGTIYASGGNSNNWNDSYINWQYINRMGFVDIASSSLSFTSADSTLTLSGSGLYIWKGEIVPFSAQSVKISGSSSGKGTYYFYFKRSDGIMNVSTDPWTLEETDEKVPIAVVDWDKTHPGGHYYWLHDERHTCLMDREVHYYLHSTFGTRYKSGGAISGYNLVGSPGWASANNQFSISEAKIADEDLDWTLTSKGIPAVNVHGWIKYYRSNSTTWTWDTTAVPYSYAAGSYIQWDNNGTMQTGVNNRFYNTYLAFTNIKSAGGVSVSDSARFIIIPGRGEYTTAAAAQAEDPKTFSWTGFSLAECIIMYRFTWSTNSTYTGALGKCKLNNAPQLLNQSVSSIPIVSQAASYWTSSGNDIFNTNTGNVSIGYSASPKSSLVIAKAAASINLVDPNFNLARTADSVAASDTSSMKFQVVQGNPTVNFRNSAGALTFGVDANGGILGKNIITVCTGVLDTIRQVLTGYNKIWCGEVPYQYTVDTIVFVGYGAACNVTIKVGYGLNQTGAVTDIVTNGNTITSVTSATKISSFNNAVIPAGYMVCIYASAVTTRCQAISVFIKGHRTQ